MVTASAPVVVPASVEPLAAVVERRVAEAMGGAEPQLRRSDRADFQANGVLALAKAEGRPPTAVAESCEPHRLCAYLSALASAFSTFWEHCPVLRAEDARVRANRLLLCALSARTLELGMGLLGIEAPEQL